MYADYLDGSQGNIHRNPPRNNMVNSGARGIELYHSARDVQEDFSISESPGWMHG